MFNENFIQLNFTGDFDPIVLSNTAHYNNPNFQNLIHGIVKNIRMVLDAQSKIRQMSTFTDFDGMRYRITLYR